MRFLRAAIVSWAMMAAVANAAHAQQPDSVRAPMAAFVGRMISNLDSTPVRSANIRLVFLDSVKQVRGSNESS